MIRRHDIQVKVISNYEVRGKTVSASFDLVVATLKWTEAQAVEFTDGVYESHPDLYPCALACEQSAEDDPVISPTPVECLRFRWIGELSGPEPHEKVDEEFASRRQVVLSMLTDYLEKQSAWQAMTETNPLYAQMTGTRYKAYLVAALALVDDQKIVTQPHQALGE